MVYGRDWLDDMASGLRRVGGDIRIALVAWTFGWTFTGLFWSIRKGLQGLFRAINFANTSLSRQMEFNADLVAVSVTGSDALIHGLAAPRFRFRRAGASVERPVGGGGPWPIQPRFVLSSKPRGGVFAPGARKNPILGQPPSLPDDPETVIQIFQPEDTSVPRMWATHPSNHDREANAKKCYIRSVLDERSSWVLFQDVRALCLRDTPGLQEDFEGHGSRMARTGIRPVFY